MEVSVPCWSQVGPRKKKDFRTILCKVLNKMCVFGPFQVERMP